MFKSLNIPLEAFQEAIRSNRLNEAKVYLALKFMASNGQVRSSEIDLNILSKLSGFKDSRTINTHLDTLYQLNWIGKDNDWVFIRSFERIRKILAAPSRTAVEIRPQDIATLHECILAAKIGHSERAKRYARKKPGAKPITQQLKNVPYSTNDFSCSLIGEWFGYSPSTATRIKQKAKAIGYLDYQHNSQPINIPIEDVTDYLKVMGIDSERVFFKKKKPFIRLTDRFIIGQGNLHTFAFKTRAAL